MHEYSIYRLDTGLFTGARFSLSVPDEDKAAELTPGGCGVMDGAHDHRSKRVLAGEVVGYSPSVDVATELARAKARRIGEIDDKLAALDQQAIRPAGELTEAIASSQIPPAGAVARLGEVNAAKTVLRATRAAIVAATTLAAVEAVP